MNILITGATGLIGKALISRILEQTEAIQSAKIIALVRNISNVKDSFPSSVTLKDTLSEVDFNKVDIVINLAGEPIAEKRWTTTQKKTICESRWSITQALTKSIKMAETPPSLFISGSAIGIYGRQNSTEITEGFTDFNKEFTFTVCNQWEEIAESSASKNTRVCILRTGIVLDKSKGALNKMLPAFKLGLGGPIAEGSQMMSWIHIDDMTRAIIHIINTPLLSGKINFTAPNAVTNQIFSKTLSEVLNRPCIFRVPKFMLKLLLGEMSDLLLYGQNVIPEKLEKNDFVFEYPDLKIALSNLLS